MRPEGYLREHQLTTLDSKAMPFGVRGESLAD